MKYQAIFIILILILNNCIAIPVAHKDCFTWELCDAIGWQIDIIVGLDIQLEDSEIVRIVIIHIIEAMIMNGFQKNSLFRM